MTLSDRLTLLGAGYTKEEIEAMEPAPSPAPAADPAPNPAPAEDPAPSPAPAADPTPNPAPAAATNNAVLEALNKLTAAIQAGNLINGRQPENVQMTMNDIIKGV